MKLNRALAWIAIGIGVIGLLILIGWIGEASWRLTGG